MAINTLDPTTALLVVDLQKGIAALPTAHPMKDVVGNTVASPDFSSRVNKKSNNKEIRHRKGPHFRA